MTEPLPDKAARASHQTDWDGPLDKLPIVLGACP
jgi:hypothetical protein